MEAIIRKLLESSEPAIRWRALVGVLGRDPNDPEVREEQEAVRASPIVQSLLARRDAAGRIPGHPYAKFTGAHWVLGLLAEIGYPPGDATLQPLVAQVCELWLSEEHMRETVCDTRAQAQRARGVPVMQGRARRCGSQEGNTLWAMLTLGFTDERTEQLARNLRRWQWPDGGWNCDRRPEACHSSFNESHLPLRALAIHAKLTGNAESAAAARRASEMFLERRLFRRKTDGTVIASGFVHLHYPRYWHYDVLGGLVAVGEAGLLHDPRCAEALALLEGKRTPEGGFPAEAKHYQAVTEPMNGGSLVNWGGTGKRRANEWVTVDALTVLRLAGKAATG